MIDIDRLKPESHVSHSGVHHRHVRFLFHRVEEELQMPMTDLRLEYHGPAAGEILVIQVLCKSTCLLTRCSSPHIGFEKRLCALASGYSGCQINHQLVECAAVVTDVLTARWNTCSRG